jgi:hypothetical protein
MTMKGRQAGGTQGGAQASASGTEHDPALVQQALEEIFQSTPFRTTKQCQDLLRYVVENSLAGLDHLLRERVIGSEVFGRKPDYDTGEDPVVRLRASEVRKRLAQYYQGANGPVPVRIDIPPGSYRATFEWTAAVEAQSSAAEETALEVVAPVMVPRIQAEAGPNQSARRGRWVWVAAAVVLIALCLAAGARLHKGPAQVAFERFWQPILSGQKPVLICLGTNAVYRLSNQFMVQYFSDHHIDNHGFELFADLPPDQKIDARDLQRAYNSFVALGDVAAVSDVVATLTRQGKPYQERFPPDISFAELRNNATITVGGFNNYLTITLTKNLRYRLAQGSRIEDTDDLKKVWSVRYNGDSHDTEDYAIISRLVPSETGAPALCVAGIGQYGTQAAADFIGNPQAIANVVKDAPKGWENKSMQIVLHVKVVNYRPVSTEVLATYFW